LTQKGWQVIHIIMKGKVWIPKQRGPLTIEIGC
jgi:hypothetical protein